MRQAPILPSLNAGELSPYLGSRTDYSQYAKGLTLCQNFIPLVQGPLHKRSGTKYVAEVKDSSKSVRLIPFVFSNNDAYILEFGDQYIRFYTDGGQVLDTGVPYEVASTYAEVDLPLLRVAQSADVVYIAHPLYAPRKLSRTAPTSWTLEVIDFQNGPIGDENTTATTVTASATTGTVTLTASTSIFNADMVSQFVRLKHEDNGGVPPWEAGVAASAGNLVSYDGNYYRAANSATTGGDPPIHTEGRALDGSGGVNWEYIHDGQGIAKITGYTSGTQVTAEVTSRLPDDVVSNNTTLWALGDWSEENGYPGAVTFYGDRLYWAGSTAYPQRIWGSVVGDYENHKPGTDDDSALALTISASDVNAIRWMENDEKGLLIGTTRGEWVLRPSSQNEALTPFNGQATRLTNWGSNFVQPIRVNKAVIMIQNASRKLRELAYTLEVDGFSAPDLTVRAEHMTKSGLTSIAFQAQPDPVVWSTRADGVLLGLTYERDQDVLAWHRHPVGGTDAKAESVAVIPAPDESRDELWMVVSRTIDGGTKRYVEYMSEKFDHDTAQEDGFFVDCGAVYSGAANSTITGLDHLEGETVAILANGATHPTRTVSGGQITLQRTATKASIGLPFTAAATTEPVDAGGAPGSSAHGARKRITQLIMSLYRTGPLKYGYSLDEMDTLETREGNDPMDTPPPLFNGKESGMWNAPWQRDASISLASTLPVPATILALVPTVEANGD